MPPATRASTPTKLALSFPNLLVTHSASTEFFKDAVWLAAISLKASVVNAPAATTHFTDKLFFWSGNSELETPVPLAPLVTDMRVMRRTSYKTATKPRL